MAVNHPLEYFEREYTAARGFISLGVSHWFIWLQQGYNRNSAPDLSELEPPVARCVECAEHGRSCCTLVDNKLWMGFVVAWCLALFQFSDGCNELGHSKVSR